MLFHWGRRRVGQQDGWGKSEGNERDNQVCDTRVGMYWKEAYCLVQFPHIVYVPVKAYFQRIV